MSEHEDKPRLIRQGTVYVYDCPYCKWTKGGANPKAAYSAWRRHHKTAHRFRWIQYLIPRFSSLPFVGR